MKPLRAFLCCLDETGDWGTSAFRELEPLLTAWTEVLGAGRSGAALHVGFSRPDTPAMAALARAHPGRLLLSEAAVHALPGPLSVSEPVGQVGALPFRLALTGFGYEATPPEVPISLPTPQAVQKPRLSGWLAHLAVEDPTLFALAESVGISDEESYVLKEGALARDARHRLGLARYHQLTGRPPREADILDHLMACPPWLVALALTSFPLTVRQQNVFRENDLTYVRDVARLGTNGLFKLDKMGRKSVTEFARDVLNRWVGGPPLSSPSTGAESGSVLPQDVGAHSEGERHSWANLSEAMIDAAHALPQNYRGVLAARMGFRCERMTLQQIAADIGLTRERVRQIEKRASLLIAGHAAWSELERRITALLVGRSMPLFLHGLPALDSWFDGLSDLYGPLDFIFDKLLDGRLSIIDLDGTPCISRLSVPHWLGEVDAAKRLIEHAVPDHLLQDEARQLVECLLVGPGEELRGDLWSIASRSARFVETPDGAVRLMGYGDSAESVVHAILAASASPLHYSEIQRLATQQGDYAIKRIHAAAGNVGVLYARGTFGLVQHCPLTMAEIEIVRAEVEDLMGGEAADRQWHCTELCDALFERGLSFDERLTKYVVNFALKGVPRLAYLGRMVWGLSDAWRQSAASRIDVRQAVVALLEQAGHPLTTAEIRARLEMERGVNVHFQIFPVDPLVRIGPGQWGLLDRDVALNEAEAKDVLRWLKGRIEALGHGVHLTEVEEELRLREGGALADLNPYAIATLAKECGLRVDRGQYVYPTSWESSGRYTIQDAVQMALDELGDSSASFEQLYDRVAEISRRECARATISGALKSVGAVFDAATGQWAANMSTVDDEQGA